MTSNILISICLATYNGSKFIEEQLLSIMSSIVAGQLHHSFNYEIIIVDDCSKDDTIKRIAKLNLENLTVFSSQINLGHVATFERALSLSSGQLIFLSDQDDIWTENHIRDHIRAMPTTEPAARFGGLTTFSSSASREPRYLHPNLSSWRAINLGKILLGTSECWGCTMCLNSRLKDVVLPFPATVEAHDLFIALAANAHRNLLFQKDVNVLRRIHEQNVTPQKRRPLWRVVKTRVLLLSQWTFLIWNKALNRHAA